MTKTNLKKLIACLMSAVPGFSSPRVNFTLHDLILPAKSLLTFSFFLNIFKESVLTSEGPYHWPSSCH